MSSVGITLGAPASPEVTSAKPTEKARLARAATDFEAVLIGQWLDGAEHSFATVPGSEEDEDAGGEQMRGFAMQQLAHTLAATDILGIARIVQGGLEKAAAAGTGTPQMPAGLGEGALRAKLPPNL